MSSHDDLQNDSRAIGRGALANALGIVASSLGFIFYVVTARVYGIELTGLYVLAWTTLDISSKLGILGLDRALLTLIARCRATDNAREERNLLKQAVLIGLLATGTVAGLLWLAADPFCRLLLDKSQLASLLRWMIPGLPFWMISAVFSHMTRAHRVMRYEIWAKRVTEPAVLLGLASLGGLSGWGAQGLAIAFVASTASGAVLAVWLYFRLVAREDETRGTVVMTCGDLLRFCTPIGVYDLLNLLLQRVDLFLVGHYLPATAAGIYGVAQETAFAVKKVRQSFDPIVIPVISGLRGAAERTQGQFHFSRVTTWILTVGLLVFGVFFFAGRSVLALYGEAFVEGGWVLVILTASVIVNSVLGISELFILLDHPTINLVNSLVCLGTAAACCFVATPLWGMEGAAVSILVAFLVMNAIRLRQLDRLYGITLQARLYFWPLVSLLGGAFCGLCVGGPWRPFSIGNELCAAALFVLVYVALLWYGKRRSAWMEAAAP